MMVIYVPVYEFDWTNHFRVRVQNENVEGQMDGQTNGQMNRQNYTYLERNLGIMVSYVPVKFEFDWTNHFGVRVQKQKCGRTDGWTDKQTENEQTNRQNYTNLERNLRIMVIYVPVKFRIRLDKPFSS